VEVLEVKMHQEDLVVMAVVVRADQLVPEIQVVLIQAAVEEVELEMVVQGIQVEQADQE
jgi:hypothetical protein